MPKVSIVILNWNGKKFLKDCLTSLSRINYQPVEILVVDNNSSDGSVEFVKQKFPQAKLIANRQNYGFAKGNNLGLKAATGEYILFLNNDTVVTPDFLRLMIEDFQQDLTLGCIQPQMRMMTDKTRLDEAGAYLAFNGFLYHYGYRKDYRLPNYQVPREIFSAKGACMLIPRKVIAKVGGFDEDFFIFFEETDLCYRIWLAGYTVRYEPRSVIYHLTGGDTVDRYSYSQRIYLTFRNMNCAYLKNFGTRNLLMIFPLFVVMQLGVLFSFILQRRFYLLPPVFKAWGWNIIHLQQTLKKRKIIQHHLRKLADRELNRHIVRNPRPSYYYYLLTNLQRYKDV